MDLTKLPAGKNPPDEVNVLIEVPLRSDPIKYEYDKDSGFIFVDRFLYTTMFYPCNYGFVPQTLAEDGDPVDVMVIGRMPLLPGSVVRARPIGVLKMEDEAGMDEKILAVPIDKVTQVHRKVASYRDVPEIDLARIAHFFEHYKDLEPNKWVKVLGWADIDEAKRLIVEGIERARK
ncbi:inorganic diphosphatase [Geminicoccaceae bacterium 1502E]|uniref:Inorganic pyrophosphatase n=1 Tax=Marinimicrococcus flavescens TaxID=3031815 RepID=A0AAP3UZD4_9PROT|nr:inorganic diphosphatase [Marinimicrococcus flavescens]MDX6750527.1 inorganic diphosphatase [Geminicoccaceae bacterium 1502E]